MNFKPSFVATNEKRTYESVTQYMVKVKDLITFTAEQPIFEVIDTIIEKKISGAPVLDHQKKLIGIISEKDCLRIIVDMAYHNQPMEPRKVSDYMTRDVKTLNSESDIVDAANAFLNAPIRRLPIVENGVLVGQISRRDILRAAKDISPTTW